MLVCDILAGYISQTMKLGANLPVYRTFALEELKEATNNFDASSLMSEGSHGQVYMHFTKFTGDDLPITVIFQCYVSYDNSG